MSPDEDLLDGLETLNAKRMSDEEIALGFVPPAQFDTLSRGDHSFLVGPRGSGKTTLLRMLQGSCLTRWEGERSAEVRRRIKYSAVFLPADRLWMTQAEAAGSAEEHPELAEAAFGAQLLGALVDTMIYRTSSSSGTGGRTHLPAQLSRQDEVTLAQELAELWRLTPRLPSLQALRASIDARLVRITELVEHEDFAAREPWLANVPLADFRFGISAFNRAVSQPSHRWALLLDEMEIAPDRIFKQIYAALRTGGPNVIYKLAISPVNNQIPPLGPREPMADHDYTPIYLLHGQKFTRRFTQGLWKRLMVDADLPPRTMTAVLGSSILDSSARSGRRDPYADPRRITLIREMYRNDASFFKYCESHQVDVDRLEDMSYRDRSATLRKFYPILVYRNAIMDFSATKPRRRQRQKLTDECFTGIDAVIAALEGNPRWIKSACSRMLQSYHADRPGAPVERGAQYSALIELETRFESLLRMLQPIYGQSRIPVLSLVDAIARYFHAANTGPFTTDAPNSFIADRGCSPEVFAALEVALYAGAIVHERGPTSPAILTSTVNEKFRLAHLLALHKQREIPLRRGRPVALSSILHGTRWEAPPRPPRSPLPHELVRPDSVDQAKLF